MPSPSPRDDLEHRIIIKSFPGGRPILLAVAIVLHGAAFWMLSTFVIYPAPPAPTDASLMLRVDIPKPATPPATPPPPPPAEVGGGTASMLRLPETPAAPMVVTSPTSTDFTMPRVTLPSASASLANFGPSGGSGTGAGTGQGAGDLLGGGVASSTKIAVIADASGSMATFNRLVADYLITNYHNARLYQCGSALGKTKAPSRIDPSNIRWQPSSFSPPWPFPDTTTDIYGEIYLAIKDDPEVIVVMTDFEDGYDTRSTDEIIAALRERHIKLILLSREMAAYPKLPEYSQESSGAYNFIQVSDTAVTNITANPQLPVCPPGGIPHQ